MPLLVVDCASWEVSRSRSGLDEGEIVPRTHGLPTWQEISRVFPHCRNKWHGTDFRQANMLGEVQKALEAARALQKELRDNRKKFCDDGTPERYDRTCKNMQRCDSVTIHVSCDADMKFLMETGWYRQRPWPGGPVIPPNSQIFQPTKESQSICGLSEELACTK